MMGYRRIPIYLLFVLASLFAGCGSAAKSSGVMSENNVPSSVESTAQRLTLDLQNQGFEVSRGYFKLWTVDQCAYTFGIMGMCYANNPAAPYVTFAVLPWSGEYVDAATSSLWGPSQEGYNDIFRFDRREAIVILGELPPQASYFSEQTYIFSRQGTYQTSSNTYAAIAKYMPALLRFFFAYMPDDTTRFQSFSTLSNPINNVVIERQSGAAFGEIRYFIITPDQFMNDAIRKALAGISINDEDIFTEPIPSDMKIGLDQTADNFTTFIRYSQPYDGGTLWTSSDTWRKNLPLVVLRVRDTRTDREPQRYSPVELETRTAVDEYPLKPELISLLSAVAWKWGQPCVNSDCSDRTESFKDLQTFPPYMVGPSCISIGENCLGDNWDAAYQLYGPASLDNGEIYAVAGTLGTKTGNATYVGFGINYADIFLGVANISNKDLEGTASGYATKVSNTDKFYLYYFTRDCSGLDGLTDGHCFELPVTLIPSGRHLGLSVRDYVRPGTERGPDSSFVLPSMVIKLQRP
ncbi:MAG: hypothetical protein HQL08_06460 [Nitrospirae bacterium]|nr:hypothetical protein [Nitrospirota bacterium]